VSYQKVVETKSDHHHCPITVYILTTSKIEAFIEIHAEVSMHFRWGGGEKERGRGTLASLSR
jgi:hypothetical protein